MATPIEFEAVLNAAQLNKYLADLRANVEGTAKALNTSLGGTVTKRIALETVADESGARKLVAVEKERLSVVDKIIQAQKKLDKTETGSVINLSQAVNEAKQARNGIARLIQETDQYGNRVTKVNERWIAQNQRVRELSRELDRAGASNFWQRLKADLNIQGLASASNQLVQFTQGLQAVSIVVGQLSSTFNRFVNEAAEIQQFELAFKAIGAGAGAAFSSLRDAERIALGLGTNLDTVQSGFQQLSPVVLNVGGSMSDVSAITEALSSRFAAFGISGDRARRVMNGVIQAFAKGKLQAEELTQQISEADPAFKTDLAKSIGKTVQELEAMVKAGEVTTDVLIEFLPELSKADLLFGKLGPSATSAVDALASGNATIDQVRNNLQTLSQLNLRNLATIGQPIIEVFLRVQAVITDFLTRLSESGATSNIINVFSRISQSGVRLLESLLLIADGAVRVIGVITPFIDLFTRIPGVVELAGLALIGKLLGPLKSLQFGWTAQIAAIDKFRTAARRAFAGVQPPPIKPFDDFRREIGRPVTAGRVNFGDALNSAQAAANATTSTVSAAEQKIRNQYRATYTEFAKLQQQKTAAAAGGTAFPAKEEARLQRLQGRVRDLQLELRDFSSPRNQINLGADAQTRQVKNLTNQIDQLQARLKVQVLESQKAALAAAKGVSVPTLERAPVILTGDELNELRRINAEIDTLRDKLTAVPASSLLGNQLDDADALNRKITELTEKRDQLVGATTAAEDKIRKQYRATYTEFAKLQQQKADAATSGVAFSDREEARLQRLQRRTTNLQSQLRDLFTGGAESAARFGDSLEGSVSASYDRAIAASQAYASTVSSGASKTQVATSLNAALAASSEYYTETLGLANQRLKEYNASSTAVTQRIGELTQLQGRLSAQLASTSYGSADADRLRTQLKGVTQEISTLQSSQNNLQSSIQGTNQTISDINERLSQNQRAAATAAASTNRLGRAATRVGSAIDGAVGLAGKGIQGIAAALGPIGIALLAIGAATKLYSDGVARANAASKEFKDQTEALTRSLAELKGAQSTIAQAPPESALESFYAKIALGAAQVGDGVIGLGERIISFYNQVTSAIDGAIEKTGPLANVLRVVTSPLITFGLFNVFAGGDTEAASLTREVESVEKQIKKTIVQANLLINALSQDITPEGIKEGADERVNAAFGTLDTAITAIQKKIDDYNLSIKSNESAIKTLGDEYTATAAKLKELEAAREAGTLQPEDAPKIDQYKRRLQSLSEEQEKTRAKNVILSKSANELSTVYEALSKRYDALAQAAGRVQTKNKDQLNSLGQLEERYKSLKDSVSELDLTTPKGRSELRRITEEAAEVSLKIREIKESADLIEKIKIEAQVDEGIERGEIASSISNLQYQIQLLEGISATVDINSPELPDLIARLTRAKRDLDDLNGRRAQITLQVVQQGISSGEIPRTIANLEELQRLLSERQKAIDIDTTQGRNELNLLTQEAAELSVQLRAIKELASFSEAIAISIEIDKQITSGKLAESISNIETKVQSLESASASVDIKSPELPRIISELTKAGDRIDQLNGRKAQVTVEILQQGISTGEISNTVSNLERIQQGLQQQQRTVDIYSPQADTIAQQIEQNRRQQEFATKSNDEIERELQRERASQKQQDLQMEHDRQRQIIQERKQALQDELNRSKEIADARVKELQQLTFSERELARLRVQDLQKQAQGGGRRGLEARAQLERLARDEQIARIKEEQDRKEAQIQQKIRQEEAIERQLEKTFREQMLAIQQEMLKLERQKAGQQITAAEQTLEERRKAEEASKQATSADEQRLANLREQAGQWARQAASAKETASISKQIVDDTSRYPQALSNGADQADRFAESLKSSAGSAEMIAKYLRSVASLNGQSVNINVNQVPARFLGGPVSAGQTYQVNEIGTEGFLSSGGALREISRPRNSLWRAPSSGTVIPADIWSAIKAPDNAISVNPSPLRNSSKAISNSRVEQAVKVAIARSSSDSQAIRELASVQVHQSQQIGKLSRAVTDLAHKDWNVNVGLNSRDDAVYLRALNSRL